MDLLRLVMHETYPGHHTERACKDELLVRGRGLLEESIVLVPTPQSLIAEGIAVLAPPLLLEGDAGPELAAVLAAAGVELDLAHALAVERAREPCRWAEVNGALLLHEDGTQRGRGAGLPRALGPDVARRSPSTWSASTASRPRAPTSSPTRRDASCAAPTSPATRRASAAC